MHVAILEITSLPTTHLKSMTAKQYTSVFPQAIACWAQDAGHQVEYRVYSGAGQLPRFCAPDVLFVRTTSQCSVLAYIAAKQQPSTTLKIIGGPHAVCHPEECLEYFDVVVDGPCNQDLILRILDRCHGDSVLHSDAPTAIPGVKQRWPFIQTARSRIPFLSVIGMLSSVGCGGGCSFCIDCKTKWQSLPAEQLKEDLLFLQRKSRRPVLFQDPNVGRHIDHVLDTMISIDWKNRWAFETDLRSLTLPRLQKIQQVNCCGIGIGIESWTDYSKKTGLHRCTPEEKYQQVTQHLDRVKSHIPLITANMLWPNDSDTGAIPIQLTHSLIKEHPGIWSVLNFPTAYARTPFYQKLQNEKRLLPLPLVFQTNGYLTIIPNHYSPIEAVERFVEFEIASEVARKKANPGAFVKFVSWIYKHGTGSTAQRLVAALREEEMRAFHEGRQKTIPQWYWREYMQLLGPYAQTALSLEHPTGVRAKTHFYEIPQSAP